MRIVTSAFSLNMVSELAPSIEELEHLSINVVKISLSDISLKPGEFESAVGHKDTAALFSNLLGVEIPMERKTIVANEETKLLVGQYQGPRLPEGTTSLPEGATIEWYLVAFRRKF